MGFGFGAEKGTEADQKEQRGSGYYHHYFIPKKNDMAPKI